MVLLTAIISALSLRLCGCILVFQIPNFRLGHLSSCFLSFLSTPLWFIKDYLKSPSSTAIELFVIKLLLNAS